MGLIRIALFFFAMLTCGNDFLPFLMPKSTVAHAFKLSFGFRVPIPVRWTPFYSSEHNPEINSQDKWLDYVRSNPLGRLFGLHNDLDQAGINFREFDLAQHEPELHHGTGPVVYPDEVPTVSRTRRSALSDEEWLAKAKSQYEARQQDQIPDAVTSTDDSTTTTVAEDLHETFGSEEELAEALKETLDDFLSQVANSTLPNGQYKFRVRIAPVTPVITRRVPVVVNPSYSLFKLNL